MTKICELNVKLSSGSRNHKSFVNRNRKTKSRIGLEEMKKKSIKKRKNSENGFDGKGKSEEVENQKI